MPSFETVQRAVVATVVGSALAASVAMVAVGSAPVVASAAPVAAPVVTSAPVTPAAEPVVEQAAQAAPVVVAPVAPKVTAKPKPKVRVTLSCEPNAAPKFGDPSDPNKITNKACPAANKAKAKAQNDYAKQLQAERDALSSAALQACVKQTGQTVAQCKAQAASGGAS